MSDVSLVRSEFVSSVEAHVSVTALVSVWSGDGALVVGSVSPVVSSLGMGSGLTPLGATLLVPPSPPGRVVTG